MGDNTCIPSCDGPLNLCDGDTTNNEWVDNGICLLNTMTDDQIIYSIERNPKAREDLRRVTTCVEILGLLDLVPLLPSVQEDDAQQRRFNSLDCLPFYTVLGGNFNNR